MIRLTVENVPAALGWVAWSYVPVVIERLDRFRERMIAGCER